MAGLVPAIHIFERFNIALILRGLRQQSVSRSWTLSGHEGASRALWSLLRDADLRLLLRMRVVGVKRPR
jgi:hypothetical protein